MNLNEFNEIYRGFTSYQNIEIKCDDCGKMVSVSKTHAQQKIRKWGKFLYDECASKERFKLGLSQETKDKLRAGRLGKKHSDESRQKMSESATIKWETDWGKKQRKNLSHSTSKQHSSKKFDKSKRKVLYFSAKNNNEIKVCNSSYEFIACEDFLEKDESVVSYGTQVQYETAEHSRSLDLLLNFKDGSKKVIEVKPKKRLNEEYHAKQIVDSRKNAEKNGWLFEVWTEDNLKIVNSKEATKRADEYRKQHFLVDYASYRAAKDREKARRFYDRHIRDNKVIVYCDFCRIYHKVLKISYEANIKRNDHYICEREGGFISGSKPKKKKENPFASQGKKQCTKCGDVKLFEEFNSDKSRSDGRSNKCQKCNADECKARYNRKVNKNEEK